MDFNKGGISAIKYESSSRAEIKYVPLLLMYNDVPRHKIQLHDFETFAKERLQVLRIIEQSLKNNQSADALGKIIVDEVKKQGFHKFAKLISGRVVDSKEYEELRKYDNESHYILRLVYCQNESLRKWFLARELDLFKFRWNNLLPNDRRVFLNENNLKYEVIDEDQCRELIEKTGGFVRPNLEYYLVNWTKVSDLVRRRRTFVCNGFAYITAADLISVIGSDFRSRLSHSLAVMGHKAGSLRQDERIKRLMDHLPESYTGKPYIVNEKNSLISWQNIDALAKISFPPCMRQLHQALRAEHHLRHYGRQQYSLFLKGIGLPLEDALIFWKAEFTKKIDPEKFDKQYAYNFRHNYGKEGKRTNYTPYSCMKIIKSSVGPAEYHGCPFRHNDRNSVEKMLTSAGIAQNGILDIMSIVNQEHYQHACSKFFEITHNGVALPSAVVHPNQYFEESQKITNFKNVSQPPSQSSTQQSISSAETEVTDEQLAELNLDNFDDSNAAS